MANRVTRVFRHLTHSTHSDILRAMFRVCMYVYLHSYVYVCMYIHTYMTGKLVLSHNGKPENFKFDRCFPQESSQEEVIFFSLFWRRSSHPALDGAKVIYKYIIISMYSYVYTHEYRMFWDVHRFFVSALDGLIYVYIWYIYIHLYEHIYVYIHIHTYMCIYIYVYTHGYTYTYSHTCIYTYMDIYTWFLERYLCSFTSWHTSSQRELGMTACP